MLHCLRHGVKQPWPSRDLTARKSCHACRCNTLMPGCSAAPANRSCRRNYLPADTTGALQGPWQALRKGMGVWYKRIWHASHDQMSPTPYSSALSASISTAGRSAPPPLQAPPPAWQPGRAARRLPRVHTRAASPAALHRLPAHPLQAAPAAAARRACRRGAAASCWPATQSRARPRKSARRMRGATAGCCSPCCRCGVGKGQEEAGKWGSWASTIASSCPAALTAQPCLCRGGTATKRPQQPPRPHLRCTFAPCSSTRDPAGTSTGTNRCSLNAGMSPASPVNDTEPSAARRKRRCTPPRWEPAGEGVNEETAVMGEGSTQVTGSTMHGGAPPRWPPYVPAALAQLHLRAPSRTAASPGSAHRQPLVRVASSRASQMPTQE